MTGIAKSIPVTCSSWGVKLAFELSKIQNNCKTNCSKSLLCGFNQGNTIKWNKIDLKDTHALYAHREQHKREMTPSCYFRLRTGSLPVQRVTRSRREMLKSVKISR